MNNLLEQVNKYKTYGLKFVPVDPDTKKPHEKNGHWKGVDWTDDDFAVARGAGIMHKESNIIAVDYDDAAAWNFRSILPPTLTIKTVKGYQQFYSYDGETKLFDVKADRKKGKKIIEVLHNTQSVFLADSRKVINDVEPYKINDEFEYNTLLFDVGKIGALTYLSKYYPESGAGQRDDYIMRVAGCLVRHSKLSVIEMEDFIERLCIDNNDREIKNRKDKVRRIKQGYDNKKPTFGITELGKFINVDKSIVGNIFNYINEVKVDRVDPYTALSLTDFTAKEFPPKEYLLYPIIEKGSITQVYGSEGVGKTLFTAGLALSISSGLDFLKYKNHNKSKTPVLIVDGEMTETELQERFVELIYSYTERKVVIDTDRIKLITLGLQMNGGIDPLNFETGQKRLEANIKQLSELWNDKPVIILDNLTYLTSLDEKEGAQVKPFMQWLINLRSDGYTIIFIHHETKSTGTSSGSNMKERPINCSIRLRRPEKKEEDQCTLSRVHLMVVAVNKLRGKAIANYKKDYVACISEDNAAWTYYEIQKEKPKKELAYEYWIAEGHTSWTEDMKDHEEHSISKSQFYKIQNKQKEKDKENII